MSASSSSSSGMVETRQSKIEKMLLIPKTVIPAIIILFLFSLLIAIPIVLGQKMSRKFLEPKETIAPVQSSYASENLCNYFIKASYNSCASGDYANDFVSLEALRNVIKHGCRYLDFEVYNINDDPIVAVSNTKTFNFKGTFNSIPMVDVLNEIKNSAFSMTAPNPQDPLFLQFRIKSNHAIICSKIANLLQLNFTNKLMSPQYSYQNQGRNIGAVPMSAFMGKVAIAVETNNPLVKSSPLMEFVNLSPSDAMHRVYTFPELAYNAPSDVLTNSSSFMTSVVPDGSSKDNFDSGQGFNKGVQIILMQFQNDDQNLKLYIARFEGRAFLLKPDELQENPMVITPQAPMDPSLSFSAGRQALDQASVVPRVGPAGPTGATGFFSSPGATGGSISASGAATK